MQMCYCYFFSPHRRTQCYARALATYVLTFRGLCSVRGPMSVCVLVMTVSIAKTAEPIRMPFRSRLACAAGPVFRNANGHFGGMYRTPIRQWTHSVFAPTRRNDAATSCSWGVTPLRCGLSLPLL